MWEGLFKVTFKRGNPLFLTCIQFKDHFKSIFLLHESFTFVELFFNATRGLIFNSVVVVVSITFHVSRMKSCMMIVFY